ncbi:NAAT family transporter [bacterium]|nr:MAG: NAAT family transporter [bacterium]
MPPTEDLIKTFVTFVVMAHVFGTIPVFLAETAGMDPAKRASVNRRAAVFGTATLIVSCVLGEAMLSFFGVTTDSLRAAGGLIILLGALQMVKGGGHGKTPEEDRSDPAVIPLAIPMFAGPGFIGAVIIASQNTDGILATLILIGMILVVGLLWWIAMSSATWIGRKLGEGGLDVVTRISGLLLAALAAEMIAEGSRKLFGIGT